MQDVMDIITIFKGILISFFVSVATYFLPIGPFVVVIGVAYVLNFLAGLFAGLLVNDERFSFKKAFWCLIEAAVYLIIIATCFIIGDYMDDKEAILKGIHWVTYAFIYFYAVNILKNLMLLFPQSRAISFLYFLLSMEFVKKIPFMPEFLNYEKNETGYNNNPLQRD